MADEIKPMGTFPESEARHNPALDDMDLKDLRELVEWPSKMEKFEKASSGTDYTPVDEEEAPPQQVVEEVPDAEPEPIQAEESQEPVAEVEPEPEAESSAPEPEQVGDDLEFLRLKLEAIEADNRKLAAQNAGRQSGERGYINQLKREIEQLRAGATDEFTEEAVSQPRTRAAEPTQSSISAWAVERAISDAAAHFAMAHSDHEELKDGIAGYIQQSGYDPQRLLEIGDPIEAGREVTRVLEESYWHVKAEKTRQRVAELQQKRADSMPGLERAKRKAAVSASGSSTPPPKPATKTDDLSLEELAKRVRAMRK